MVSNSGRQFRQNGVQFGLSLGGDGPIVSRRMRFSSFDDMATTAIKVPQSGWRSDTVFSLA
jgi:hypothetical protein